ncbi:hypothetical protein HD806DRAFT_545042 [Xylariaceae sp. AK1471]|nr:hypothetical protein HD806DRAFT_545042 [Xylariaceae sp. AK1471]
MSSPFDLSSLSLSDRHTVVTPDGQRYRFERITDQDGAKQPSVPSVDKYCSATTDEELSRHLPSNPGQKLDNSNCPTTLLEAFHTSQSNGKLLASFGGISQTLARDAENPIVPYSNRIQPVSLTQMSPLENAHSNPMIPVVPLQGPLRELKPPQNSEHGLHGKLSRPSPLTDILHPPDGLMPVVGSRRTSVSSRSGHLAAGERLVFERVTEYSRNYLQFKAEGLKQALLKIYESPLTKDLRFSLITGGTGEWEYTFRVSHGSGEIVLAYAYETSWPEMVYLQELSGHKTKDLLPPESRQIIWMCRFSKIDDLADFQSRMLGEDVVLDISSVRAARVKTKKKEISNTGCRIQIWHERKDSHGLSSDKSSYISYDTVLSGPSKEKTMPGCDRLLIFFNRLEEYLSIPITDDIETKRTSDISVTLKSRRYTAIWGKRDSIKGYHARRTSHAAGFPLRVSDAPPVEQSADEKLQSIIIEFESQRGLDNFMEIWNQSLRLRREHREMLRSIQEEMNHEQLTGKDARSIWFYSG